jgi:hypothetical protein
MRRRPRPGYPPSLTNSALFVLELLPGRVKIAAIPMKSKRYLIPICLAVLLSVVSAQAQFLWSEHVASSASLIGDPTPEWRWTPVITVT